MSTLPLPNTKILARERREQNKRRKERIAAAQAEAREVVASGTCPRCGRPLRRNLALKGWYQCEQFGAPQFRKDADFPDCNFQCFTE